MTVTRSDVPIRSMVVGTFSAIFSVTGRPSTKEKPHASGFQNCQKAVNQLVNCSTSGLSRP